MLYYCHMVKGLCVLAYSVQLSYEKCAILWENTKNIKQCPHMHSAYIMQNKDCEHMFEGIFRLNTKGTKPSIDRFSFLT